MADNEVTQGTPSSGAATPSNEATPAQGTTGTEVRTESTSGVPKDWVYNGDRNKVPDPFKNYVAGIDRYWTQKSQAFADYEKKAKEYDSFVNSDDFKTFQQFKAGNRNPTGEAQPQQVNVTQEELDNIMLGDAATLEKVIERKATALLESKAKEFEKAIEPLAMKQKENDAAEMVKEFARLHPDFWELYEGGHGDYMTNALKQGTSLEKVYETAKFFESKIEARLAEKNKKEIEEKKKGTSVSSTVSGVPDVVFANDERSARRLAIELALKNDPRSVQIRKK